MTDQDKPNSTSEPEQEVVNEYTLTASFLQQYKKYKLGMLEGGLFSIREQQAITASIIGDPSGMHSFIENATSILIKGAREEFPVEAEVLDCVNHFNGAVYQVVMFAVVPLLKMPQEQKDAIRLAHMERHMEETLGSVDPYANLDFDMNGPKQQP